MEQFFERLTITFSVCAALCAVFYPVFEVEVIAYSGYGFVILTLVSFIAYLLVPDAHPQYNGD